MSVNPPERPKKRGYRRSSTGKQGSPGGSDGDRVKSARGTGRSQTVESRQTVPEKQPAAKAEPAAYKQTLAAKRASAVKKRTGAESRPPRGNRKTRPTRGSGTATPVRGPAAARPSKGPGRTSEVQAIARDLDSQLDAIRSKIAAIAGSVGEEATDPFGAMGEIFADELRTLLGDALPDAGAVRRAARLAVADQAWSQRLGSLLDTRDVVGLLDVSKQRVSTLAREHRLIALPQGARQRFPAWQFAASDPKDRECLAAAHRQLVEVGAVSPWTAASWFQQEHQELRGRDPVTYLLEGGDRARLLRVAGRDADRLAQ